jgi:hypothetical protein
MNDEPCGGLFEYPVDSCDAIMNIEPPDSKQKRIGRV